MGEVGARHEEPQAHDHDAGEDLDGLLGEKGVGHGVSDRTPKTWAGALAGTRNATAVEMGSAGATEGELRALAVGWAGPLTPHDRRAYGWGERPEDGQ